MKTNSPPHVHWYGPTCMLGALLAGILLALGHHIYYATLDENEVPAGDHDLRLFSVSRQQATAAVGTAFAFAVRSALVLAISSAYVQLFWLRLVAKSKKASGIARHQRSIFRPAERVHPRKRITLAAIPSPVYHRVSDVVSCNGLIQT